MLVPISWIKEYVPLGVIGVEELKHRMFMSGFEIESVRYLGEHIHNCFAGLVTDRTPHPARSELSVFTVEGSAGKTYTVVSGYPDLRVGDRPLVAPEGATVRPLKSGEAEGGNVIRGRVFDGVKSEGIFCSGAEFQMGDENGTHLSADWYDRIDEKKILLFDETVPAGTDAVTALGLDEYVFDVGITSNRPDCQSIVGLCKEVAAIFGVKAAMPDVSYSVSKKEETYHLRVENRAPELCPRYIGHYIDGVTVARSPEWMRRRLIMCGVNAIDNIIDVTNYLLKEFGQPMHAFDAREIKGDTIIIRRAEPDERITLLCDEAEQSHALNERNLLICNAEEPIALAGVMGGKFSAIREDTSAVVLEIAKFMKDSIRVTARDAGVSTEASARYSKGVSDYYLPLAYARALHLIGELGIGTVTDMTRDSNPYGYEPRPVSMTCRLSKINDVLGIELPPGAVTDSLSRLEFGARADGDDLHIEIPPHRDDIEDFPDIAEEVIRIYGYEHIVPTMLKDATVQCGGLSEKQKRTRKMKSRLMGLGFSEMITYSFCAPKDLERFGLDAEQAIALKNPLGDNYSVMRTLIAPSMLQCVANNYKLYGNPSGALFECGRVFLKNGDDEFPAEPSHLCMALYGRNRDFFDLKGAVETLFDAFGVTLAFERCDKPFLNPGIAAKALLGGEEVGFIGQLRHELCETYEIGKAPSFNMTVLLAEFDLDAIFREAVSLRAYTPPAEPKTERDFSLIVPLKTVYGDVTAIIQKAGDMAGPVVIENVSFVEKYVGDKIPAGMYGMTVRVTFAPSSALYDSKKFRYSAPEAADLDRAAAGLVKMLADAGIALRTV